MIIVITIYFVCALMLTFYGINSHILVQLFKNSNRIRTKSQNAFPSSSYLQQAHLNQIFAITDRLPPVTVQLPIFNELNVVERLVDAVTAFQYPQGLLEIQVLDDSTDKTCDIIALKVHDLQRKGIDIHHLRRNDRCAFKAGALREGMKHARGHLVAIFDADFVPPKDFLLRTVPYFMEDPQIGLVQARWGHLNEDESWVTRLQAIGINGHFMVEQGARSANRLFMNFNGTAGIFRKHAIFDAGNWEGDTLTEDMDLSYRMQLRGWQCRYLMDLVVPAEIPNDLNAFKSQQFRWAKGSTQTALKLMPRVWRSSASPFAKFQAFMHMTHYAIHPLMLILALLAPFLLLQEVRFLTGLALWGFGVILLLACTGPSRMYLVAEKTLGRPNWRTAMLLPFMICFGCGLAVNNTRAVLEALFGRSSAFIRTPKSGLRERKRYRIPAGRMILLELSIGLWCLFGMGLYFSSQHYLIGHFMLIYAAGFICISGFSWWHGKGKPLS